MEQNKFQYFTRISYIFKFTLKFFAGGPCHVRLNKYEILHKNPSLYCSSVRKSVLLNITFKKYNFSVHVFSTMFKQVVLC